jgi:hypothetical protein
MPTLFPVLIGFVEAEIASQGFKVARTQSGHADMDFVL